MSVSNDLGVLGVGREALYLLPKPSGSPSVAVGILDPRIALRRIKFVRKARYFLRSRFGHGVQRFVILPFNSGLKTLPHGINKILAGHYLVNGARLVADICRVRPLMRRFMNDG